MNWVGLWQTTDSMEVQLLHLRSPSLPLLPKLEFVLFAQLCQNLLHQEVHARLSVPAETVYKERNRSSEQTLTSLEVV